MRKSNNYYKFMEYVTFGKRHDDTIFKDNGVLECLSYATVEDVEDWSNSPYLKCTNHKIGLPNDWLTFKNVLVNEDTIIIYYLTNERQVRIATFLLDNYKTQKELKWDILKSCVEFFLNNDNFSTEILETADFDDNDEYEELLESSEEPTETTATAQHEEIDTSQPHIYIDTDNIKYLMETHSFPSTPTHEPTSKKVRTSSIYGMFGGFPSILDMYNDKCFCCPADRQGNRCCGEKWCKETWKRYEAIIKPEWHNVSLATLANLDIDMLDEKRQTYLTAFRDLQQTLSYLRKCKTQDTYDTCYIRYIKRKNAIFAENKISYAMYRYIDAKLSMQNVESGVWASKCEEATGYHESRRYNKSRV